jgi:hypothetical protein
LARNEVLYSAKKKKCVLQMLFKLLLCLLLSSIGALKFSGEDVDGNTTSMG